MSKNASKLSLKFSKPLAQSWKSIEEYIILNKTLFVVIALPESKLWLYFKFTLGPF